MSNGMNFIAIVFVLALKMSEWVHEITQEKERRIVPHWHERPPDDE